MKEIIALTGADLRNLESAGGGFRFAGAGPAAILSYLIPSTLVIAGLALLVFVTIAGYKMMTSKGDPKSLAGAQAQITWGIIGFLLVFFAYWITRFVYTVLGIPQDAFRNPFGFN